MSSGFAHLAVRATEEAVASACAANGVTAAIGPTEDRWCGVVVTDGDLDTTAAGVSGRLDGTVLRVVGDGNALDLALFVWGDEVARCVCDGAAVDEPVVERLIDASGAQSLPATVADVLGASGVDAAERYRSLIGCLGLPGYLDELGAGGYAPTVFRSVGTVQ